MTEHKTYDAIVLGGGPAGATAATVLAQRGRRVVLLDGTDVALVGVQRHRALLRLTELVDKLHNEVGVI